MILPIDKEDILPDLERAAEVVYLLKEARFYSTAYELALKSSLYYDFNPSSPNYNDTLAWLEMALDQMLPQNLEDKLAIKIIRELP